VLTNCPSVAAAMLLLLSAGLSFATSGPGTTYLYDAEGRLIQATISDGTTVVQITYTYDSAGNLISVSEQRLNN